MKRKKHQSRTPSLLPRGRKERRRIELLGGSAFAVAALVITLVFFAASAQRFLMSLPQTAAVVTAVLVDLANGDRASNALAALTVDPKLVAAAQAKANDMARGGYFAHVSPDGKDPWHWFKEAGYSFVHAGENLAVDFSDSSDVEKAWMNSPAHRENILDGKYTQIGIAIAEGEYQGRKTIFVVQEFGLPAQAGTPQPIAQTIPLAQEIAIQHIPESPTSIATAVAAPPAEPNEEPQQVLGSTNPTPAAPDTEPAVDIAPTAHPDPLSYAVASPRTSLPYAYGLIAIFLIAALAYTTRFEMKKHHLRHVKSVTLLIVFMGAILLAANYLIFTEPIIASTGPSAAHGL